MGDAGRRYWFGPKRIGLGWRPVTWQGWLVVLVAAAVILIGTPVIGSHTTSTAEGLIFPAMIAGVLIVVCIVKGTTKEADVHAQRRRRSAVASDDPSIAEAVTRFDARAAQPDGTAEPR